MRIKITLRQLESLLQQQKQSVIEIIAGNSYQYNSESTDGNLKSLPIDKDKIRQIGMKASFPEEYNTLKKYIEDGE